PARALSARGVPFYGCGFAGARSRRSGEIASFSARGWRKRATFFAKSAVTCYFHRVRPLLGLLAFAALGGACDRRAAVARPPTAPSAEAALAAATPGAPEPPPEVPSWVEAMRGEN